MSLRFVTNDELFSEAIEPIYKARSFVWISTADIKGVNTRNFESGIVSSEPELVALVMKQFDEVWMGKFCGICQRREFCGDPIL